jgi:hypothetical protein
MKHCCPALLTSSTKRIVRREAASQNRLGISRVVLLLFKEWLKSAASMDLMAQAQLARPMMSHCAGLNPDQARRLLGKER